MKRLILTADASSAGALKTAGRADIVIPLDPRFVWGPLPSDTELAGVLAARTTQKPGSHWLDYASPQNVKKIDGKGSGLIELCQGCETVEFWMENRAQFPARVDLAVGPSALARKSQRHQPGPAPRGRQPRRGKPGGSRQMGISCCVHHERSSRNRKSRMAGLPRANARGVVRPVERRPEHLVAAPTLRP
jgi:hypothetical protein